MVQLLRASPENGRDCVVRVSPCEGAAGPPRPGSGPGVPPAHVTADEPRYVHMRGPRLLGLRGRPERS